MVGSVADPVADPAARSTPPRRPGADQRLATAQAATGRHRSDVALADLLAEALMAYQTGRRSQLAASAPLSDAPADRVAPATHPVDRAAPATPPPVDRAAPANHPTSDGAGSSVVPFADAASMVHADTGPVDRQPRQVGRDEGDDQPEPDPTVTQPTRVEIHTNPIPISQVLLDSGDPLGYPFPVTLSPSRVDAPGDEVWREPGTF